MKLLLLPLTLLVSVSLCTQQSTQDIKQQAVFSCLQTCKDNAALKSYENGPCLSDNNTKWNVSDWVCDVAHSPRQAVDNLPENQCQAFRNGEAHHFVEVDSSCNLITVV
jgi:hypothetical protein